MWHNIPVLGYAIQGVILLILGILGAYLKKVLRLVDGVAGALKQENASMAKDLKNESLARETALLTKIPNPTEPPNV